MIITYLKFNISIYKLKQPTVVYKTNVLQIHSERINNLEIENKNLKDAVQRYINKSKQKEQYIKISDYFKFVLKFYAHCNKIKLDDLFSQISNERKQVLVEITKFSNENIYVKESDYDNQTFLTKLSTKKHHKSIIEFLEEKCKINKDTFFFIQKTMLQRNSAHHVNVPKKLSNEFFKDDLLAELDHLHQSSEPPNDEDNCLKSVLLAAQIINDIELKKEKDSKINKLRNELSLSVNNRREKRKYVRSRSESMERNSKKK